jgi:hypothetical protein
MLGNVVGLWRIRWGFLWAGTQERRMRRAATVGGIYGGGIQDRLVKWRPCPLCGGHKRTWLGRRGGVAHHLRLGTETAVVRRRSCHAVYQWSVLLPGRNPYAEQTSEHYFVQRERARKVESGRELAAGPQARRLTGHTGSLGMDVATS